MKQYFKSEDFLSMDYEKLGKYTSMCVLAQPGLIDCFKDFNIKNLIALFPEIQDADFRGTVRCICSFIGIPDPLADLKNG